MQNGDHALACQTNSNIYHAEIYFIFIHLNVLCYSSTSFWRKILLKIFSEKIKNPENRRYNETIFWKRSTTKLILNAVRSCVSWNRVDSVSTHTKSEQENWVIDENISGHDDRGLARLLFLFFSSVTGIRFIYTCSSSRLHSFFHHWILKNLSKYCSRKLIFALIILNGITSAKQFEIFKIAEPIVV